jgi:apolipoprotein D and lipocalin family protein
VLAACSAPEPPAPPVFRASDAPIYSSAVLEESRLAGHWVQVATFAPGGQAVCGPGEVDFDAGQLRWDLCLADGRRSGAGPLRPGKPGRFSVDGMGDWWVLWADGDYRTLVIGTPSGQFGFVLNRESALPADRLRAVHDIVRFNGYRAEDMAVF